MPEFICRMCGLPLGKEAHMDPEPPEPDKPSYLHPHCADQAMQSALDRPAKKKKTLADAAPVLLAALEGILAAWESVPDNAKVPDEINEGAAPWDAVRTAIALAKGEQ